MFPKTLKNLLVLSAVLLSAPLLYAAEPAFPYTLPVKSGPLDAAIVYNGRTLKPLSSAAGIRRFSLETGPGIIKVEAPGFKTKEFKTADIQALLKDRIFQVKLEPEGSLLEFLGEFPSGSEPKSAYFSPEGNRLFVPLLGQHGIDVYRFDPQKQPVLAFEKRLAVPGSRAAGFVEAFCDKERRELWVSNMEENKVHIYDLDTLEYKSSAGTNGVMPKVITQNPAGDISAVSNWVSRDISLFDSKTKKLAAVIPAGGIPRGMSFSDDGALLFTAIYNESQIAVIDMNTKKVKSRFKFYEGTGAARHVIYSKGKLYVSDMYKGHVCILDAETGRLIKGLRVGSNINTIVLSPDGKYVFASSRGRNNPEDYTKSGPEFGTVTMLSAEDLSTKARVWGRNQPTGLAVSPDGNYLVFTDFLDNNIEVYRIFNSEYEK
jgi:DNA-binding beta-propeller fold protein YncE